VARGGCRGPSGCVRRVYCVRAEFELVFVLCLTLHAHMQGPQGDLGPSACRGPRPRGVDAPRRALGPTHTYARAGSLGPCGSLQTRRESAGRCRELLRLCAFAACDSAGQPDTGRRHAGHAAGSSPSHTRRRAAWRSDAVHVLVVVGIVDTVCRMSWRVNRPPGGTTFWRQNLKFRRLSTKVARGGGVHR